MTPLSRRLLILLALSGALNLLCAGLFIGSRIHHARMREAHGEHGPRGERGLRGSAPRGQASGDGAARGSRRGGAFKGLLPQEREDMLARRQARTEARQAVRAALEREPFEPAALDQALGALRSETSKTQELLHRGLSAVARDGDTEMRQRLARGFERPAGPAH